MALRNSWRTKHLCIALLAAVVQSNAWAQTLEPIEPTSETTRALPVFIVTPTLATGKPLSLYPAVIELRGTISADGRLETY